MKKIDLVTKEEVVKAWGESGNYNSGILDIHPEDVKWFKYEILKSDIDLIYHIRSTNWSPITNQTYRVEQTRLRIDLEPKYVLESESQYLIDHQDKIKDYLRDFDFSLPIKGLILIAKDINGPYTIIDGNHRFAAHYITNFEKEGDYLVCCNAFVGVSHNFSENHFLFTQC